MATQIRTTQGGFLDEVSVGILKADETFVSPRKAWGLGKGQEGRYEVPELQL